jgi:hypothetical protein
VSPPELAIHGIVVALVGIWAVEVIEIPSEQAGHENYAAKGR